MSAQKKRPTSVIGALFGFVGFSVLAGLLVTIGVTPALAVGGITANSTIGVFQSLPEYIRIGQLAQRNELYATQSGQEVPFATIYDQNRVNLTWDQVSPNLKHAAVDGEDRRFYQHGGVDLASIVRAGLGSIAGGSLGASGGGSTLTMQLVKNIRLAKAQTITDAKKRAAGEADAVAETPSRKLQEMKLAIGLEKKYTKNDILLAYLNIAYFGDQAYGVEAASEHYYNKTAADLSPTEAASLIAIVQYPATRNLATATNYPANVARRNVILKSMLQEKHIAQADYDAAVASQPTDYVHLTAPTQGCGAVTAAGAQQFCNYVVDNVPNYAFLGATPATRAKAWATGGYKIYTTLNLDLTANAKQVINKYVPATETRFNLGGAIDSVEPSTGRVIVMAQNKDYTTDVNASTTGPTTFLNFSTDKAYGGSSGFQTGSTYKMFALTDWLEKGHGLNEIVNATPRSFPTFTACGTKVKGYTPKNDEGNETGNMSVLSATANSVNVAYASMVQQLDLCDIRSTAESMGIHTAAGTPLEDNPSSFLGTNSIAPLTMASAYATIANKGTYCSPIIVDKITTPEGKDEAGQPQSCKQVVAPDVAAAVASALQGVVKSGTAVGAQPSDGTPIFGKTGTTDNADQIWLIGSSTALTTATWMGDISGEKHNLRHYASSTGTGLYASSRASMFRAVQTINDTVYPGTAFPAVNSTLVRGSGVTVPTMTGSSTASAQTVLSGVGLTYTDGGTQASALPAGQVVGSDPSAGSVVAKGTSVTVYTSDGSGASTVPNVVGQPYKNAVQAIQQAGFDQTKVTVTFTAGNGQNACQVAAITPAGGSSADKTSAIGLTIDGDKNGKDPGNCA